MEELLSYVGLDDRDRARLVELHDRLAPSFPAIAERFYDAVFAHPGTAAVLSGPAQVERLRTSLIDWMSTGLRGPYDQAFHDKRARIGKRHVQIGLAQQYMFGAMSVVRSAYLDHISSLYPAAEALLVVRSVDKLFDIELGLMLRHYQLDSEEKLLARERAIQADRVAALQTMTSGLAHEVRNPLNAAKLQLELLERRLKKGGDDPRLVEPTELAGHEMVRLTNLLNDFLSFARAPALHATKQDVVAIVRQAIDLERPLADRTRTGFVLVPTDPVDASVDPAKFHQIVQSLVTNAIEATPNGRVEIAVAIENKELHVRVTDDGSGIPEAIRHRIFEPFFTTKESGTGLGMSVAHNFVTMHGGRIDISTSERGTRIDVAIPV